MAKKTTTTEAEKEFRSSLAATQRTIRRIGDNVRENRIHPMVAEAVSAHIGIEASRSIHLAETWTRTGIVEIRDPTYAVAYTILRRLVALSAIHIVVFHCQPGVYAWARELSSILQPMSMSGRTPAQAIRMIEYPMRHLADTTPLRVVYALANSSGWRGLILDLIDCASPDGTSSVVDIVTRKDVDDKSSLMDCFGALDITSSVSSLQEMYTLSDAVGVSTNLTAFTIRLGVLDASHSQDATEDALRGLCRALGTSHVKTLSVECKRDIHRITRRSMETELPIVLDGIASGMPGLRQLAVPWQLVQMIREQMDPHVEASLVRMLAARPDIKLSCVYRPLLETYDDMGIRINSRNRALCHLAHITHACTPAITLAMADIVDDDDPSQARPPTNSAIVCNFFQSPLCDRRLLHIVADLAEPADEYNSSVSGLFNASEVSHFIHERRWYRYHMPDTIELTPVYVIDTPAFTDIWSLSTPDLHPVVLRNVNRVDATQERPHVPAGNSKRLAARLRASSSSSEGDPVTKKTKQ